MKNWLVAHAHENVWCHPYNDQLYLIKPQRLSAHHGEQFGMQVSEYSIKLPKMLKWFQVFQIGNIDPEAFNISVKNKWRNLADLVNESGTLFKVYNELGRTLPLEFAWLRQLPNRNMIIAVEMFGVQTDFSHDQLFISVYGGYFRQHNSYDVKYNSTVHGVTIRNPTDRFNMVKYYQEESANAGHVTAYINGYYSDTLTEQNIKLWDYVEVVRDGTVKSVHYFNLNDVPSFHSKLDGRRKYLLHLPKQIIDINFSNDLELFVINNNSGRLYHQHRADSLRQVTHNDFAISVARILDYIAQIDDWHNVDDLDIVIHVRHSGLERPLTFENNRIHELYKLSDSQIVEAMVGYNSQVPEWQAATLEQSAYNKVMAARYSTVSNELVTDAYGYNAVSRYAADSPLKPQVNGNVLQVKLPDLLAKASTLYEYSATGELLGYYKHGSNHGPWYDCRNNDTALVEAVQGFGDMELDVMTGTAITSLDPTNNYRFYLNVLKGGKRTYNYEDVTGTDAYTYNEDGSLSWNVDTTRREPTIVSDLKFLTYGFEADLRNGLIQFTVNWSPETNVRTPLKFVPETLELWMNGRALVEEIDYHVEWPEVVIYNKSYLDSDSMHYRPWIDVRCRGLSDTLRPAKTGFIVNGLLSNNNDFDVRDDKVVRVTVGGAVLHRDSLEFREDRLIGTATELNGLPYSVNDATVPLRGLVSEDTYVYRDMAREIDVRAEDYLSNYFPTPPGVEHNPIPRRHQVFSPILNAVIRQMINGWLVPEEDEETNYISTEKFDELMEDYHELLVFDPFFNNYHPDYVEIHPYDGYDYLELTPLQYSIVERVNQRYLNGHVVLNKLLKIKVGQHG